MKKWILKKRSFIFQIWLLNWKRKKEKKFFWIYFDLKPISKDKNQNFRIHFLISNQVMNFKKFFGFSILVMKLKNEKWKNFKIRFVFKSKNELSFPYTDYYPIFHFCFLKWHQKLKYEFLNLTFHFLQKLKIENKTV